jgi:hypothetical protein
MKWKSPWSTPSVASSLRRPFMPTGSRRPTGEHALIPSIEAVSFQGATIRSGGVAVARLRGRNVDPSAVTCTAANSGFVVDILPQRTEQGDELVLGIRIFRRIGTPRGLCLIRFCVGPATAVASITVRF